MENRKTVSFFAIRKGRRLAIEAQKQAAIAAGYDPERVIDLDAVELDDLLGWNGQPAMIRRGNWLGIFRYEFLVPVKGKGDRTARAMLKKITFRLLELGVAVEEFESGVTCKDENGALRLYANAVDRLAGARKHDSPGRPVEHVYSDADCQLIQAAWHGAEVKNPKGRTASVLALKEEDGKLRFPKFKQSTWYSLRDKGRVK